MEYHKEMLISLTVEKLENIIENKISKALEKLNLKQTETSTKADKLLTRNETASLFGISLVTLNKWSKLGILKSYKVGGKVLYKLSELEQIKK